MKAMVLAAGVGSRLDPLTSQVPKPLVPVANRPVMEHILRLLKKHGFEDVVSNLHYLPEKIRAYFADGRALGLNIDFRLESELSGDAGGVRACRDFFGQDTFIVLMGDLLTDADLSRIYAEHKRKGALATIATKQVADVSQFGVILADEDGFIRGFQEKPKAQEALSNF
ncbi:MAG: nucleotidyltransferase family protein, partial [Candidatus Obscuribacterales bacterium]|nr:nucleotidyltransferase family protein [Candidatus Obscuribacterales bacterium]